MPIVVKIQQKPFSHRFSPFSTVLPAGPNPDSLDEIRVEPFSGSADAVRKR
jgi:hypothetical protein